MRYLSLPKVAGYKRLISVDPKQSEYKINIIKTLLRGDAITKAADKIHPYPFVM